MSHSVRQATTMRLRYQPSPACRPTGNMPPSAQRDRTSGAQVRNINQHARKQAGKHQVRKEKQFLARRQAAFTSSQDMREKPLLHFRSL